MQKASIFCAENPNSLMLPWGVLSIFLLLNEQREREREIPSSLPLQTHNWDMVVVS